MNKDSVDNLIAKSKEAAALSSIVRKSCLELHKENSSVNYSMAYWAWISSDRATEQLDDCVVYLERFREKSSKKGVEK